MPAQAKVYPQDALVIIEMLKDFGINEYEPCVISQILEFGQRYVLSVLDDARMCSKHAKKRNIDHDDLKLAVMMQLENKFTTPPPRDLMLEMARPTNNVPLPYMKPFDGLSFPPKSQSILSCYCKPWKRVCHRGTNRIMVDGSQFSVGGKAYIQKRQQQAAASQMPPAQRVYPSQQFPPLPFPYPKYMKPIVVYIKEERVSPIPEIENDLPPKCKEDE